jgi:hypothetical protein
MPKSPRRIVEGFTTILHKLGLDLSWMDTWKFIDDYVSRLKSTQMASPSPRGSDERTQ